VGLSLKIAVASEGTDLNAQLVHKFGTSAYLIIVDPETFEFETIPNPGASERRGAGLQAAVLAIGKEVDVVLTAYASPAVQKHLSDAGISLISGLSGTVKQVVERYKQGEFEQLVGGEQQFTAARSGISRLALLNALRSSARQFANLLPILIGVVLLIGLFNSFISKEALDSIFSGSVGLDTLWGACFGSILAGNPINSYIIGGELLGLGVSMFAVTALIVAWVTVGLVQMPAEIAALGRKFAIVRNSVCFVFAILVAIPTAIIFNLFVE